MSIFPTRILFATDGSRDAELAATTAIGLANATGSELHMIHVGPVLPEHYDPTDVELARIHREATEILQQQTKKVEILHGKLAGSHLRMGGAAEEILHLAEQIGAGHIGAGLIVVGSRGRGRIRRALMGSVSDSVTRHAHCPVMVVRWKPVVFPARILLATDGSEESRLAASTAADLARRTDSELHVMHVGKELTHGAFPAVPVGALPGVHQDELDRQAKGLFEAEMERIESSGTKLAEAHLRRGRADEEIVVLAEEVGADLVVMGSRGLKGMRRALVGSVSDSVVMHVHCPVMVVRVEEERTVEHETDFLT